MSISPDHAAAAAPELPKLPGHTLGFIDSEAACEAMLLDLQRAGFPLTAIITFRGTDGGEQLTRMLEGSPWGESAETLLKQSHDELIAGHSVVCVEVKGDQEALTVAEISTQHGGRNVTQFGQWVDTRLT